ncbi:MAG: glycosyltransferase [gamma proteobacterium symbiont of Lucinoma myriamae]|nr:glycosyltransferase [gamma proteobacterium symbiont of Lucinoma myriamae]MCU7819393.1 glycosyltransferase [gamma proteobacterium symbiont of Lucinoma myriamae]
MIPLITIVTVTYNAAESLEETIKSIVTQDYEKLEYIIIDGGSTDGTLDIINKYQKHISFFISEEDNGIYDAMNKAVKHSNGVFINFMNAGDIFYANNTIKKLVSTADLKAGLIFGDTVFYTEDGKQDLVNAKSTDELWKAMIFNHNSLFAKRELLIRFPFDLFYKIVADSKFVIECFLDHQKFCNVNMIVNKYLTGGFSDEASILRTIERWKLVSDYKLQNQVEINDFYFKRLMYEPFYNKKYMERNTRKKVETNISSTQQIDLSDLTERITNSNKKVLIYSPIPVFPAIQGARIRISMLANALKKKGYDLYLVLLGSDWVDPDRFDPTNVGQQYQELFTEVFHFPKLKEHSKLMGKNIDIDDAYEEQLGPAIKKIMYEHEIKVILFNYIFQSKVLEYLPKDTVKIIDTHDKFTDKYKISTWYSYDAENESKGLSRADLIFSIQDNEKKYFESITNKKVITIGHITENLFIDKSYKSLDSIGIISSGHDKDLMAVEKFVKLFMQLNNSDLKLKICGMVGDKLYDKYAHPSIEYLFVVDDLRDFYSAIDLCVIPPEYGTGLKIKSAEALSFGIPIVSTKHGFEGIESGSKFHGAKNIDELFELILEIKSNQSILEELKQESRKCYLNFSEKIEKNLQSIFGKNQQLLWSNRTGYFNKR